MTSRGKLNTLYIHLQKTFGRRQPLKLHDLSLVLSQIDIPAITRLMASKLGKVQNSRHTELKRLSHHLLFIPI